MWKWVGLALVTVLTSGIIGVLRNVYLPQRRVGRFLRAHGVDFIGIRGAAAAYAWPSYIVEFDTIEKSAAFLRSPAFDALVAEVQTMHGSLSYGSDRFDARQALAVEPYVHSTTSVAV
jgi:hypothetical protein